MGEALRKRRHGRGRHSGQSWYVDETYLKVHGRWCYLYRAIDRDGNLIDTMLSATRDMRAAQRFFRSARSVAGFVPGRVTTDGHNSYPRAIRRAARFCGPPVSYWNGLRYRAGAYGRSNRDGSRLPKATRERGGALQAMVDPDLDARPFCPGRAGQKRNRQITS
jgi:transposase-like protein